MSYDSLIVTVSKLAEAARDLSRVAAKINARQHAGQPIEPTEWSDLHDATNATFAVLDVLREEEGDV